MVASQPELAAKGQGLPWLAIGLPEDLPREVDSMLYRFAVGSSRMEGQARIVGYGRVGFRNAAMRLRSEVAE